MELARKREVRKIDPDLHLGLHELSNPGEGRGSFSFQLAFAKEQAEDILRNLDNFVKNTKCRAPMRTKDFCLVHNKWESILTHQAKFPLWEHQLNRCRIISSAQPPLLVCLRSRTQISQSYRNPSGQIVA
jgi:hypothetical protein